MSEPEDKELITQARSGDRRAFETLINRYYETMFRMAFKWCGNRTQAEDITQDACIKLARSLESYRGDAAFTSWLYRLVINCGRDWMRAQNRHPDNPNAMEFVSLRDKKDETVYARQVMSEVYALPEGEREALLLVHSEGFSHKEAADILGCKESTISWRIHEARKKLAALFEKDQSYG